MLIDWFTVAAQGVNFLILVWLLKRFLYKPVLAAIDEREKRIASQLQDAEKKMEEAQKKESDFVSKNEEFDRQRASLLLDATNAANAEKGKLLGSARKDSEELRSKLQKAAEGEIDGLNKKIGTLAKDEVFSIARKTLEDLAGASLDERMADLFIHRLHELKQEEREELRSSFQGSQKVALIQSAFELTSPQRGAIAEAIKPLLHEGAQIDFATKPDLISGIELAAYGHKIGWNIAGYLASLTQAMDALVKPTSEPDPPSPKAPTHAA